MKRKWDREIAEMTQRGMTAGEISDQLNISKRTVERARDRVDMVKPRSRRLTTEELSTAKGMLEDGASYAEVARTLGRNRGAIARNLPGYEWTREQQLEYMTMCRHLKRKVYR